MFFTIKFLKNSYLSKSKLLYIHNRSITTVKKLFFFKKIFIKNSLTWINYNNNIINKHYKYGMFALTRKPFAKPPKKVSKKKR